MTQQDLLAAFAGVAEPVMWSAFLVFLRAGAVMAMLPAFGERSVPVRVRLVLTLAFTAVVAPAVPPAGAVPLGDAALAAMLAEVAAGLILGAGFRFLVLALQTAGAMAAQATSLSQLFGGMGADSQPAIANLLTLGGMAVAVAAGLHLRAAEAMVLSYELIPPGRMPLAGDAATWAVSHVTRAFALAFSLAAPFLIGSLIYNAALGAINRAMPQLMVAFIGAPALTAGGLVVLALTAPFALALWLRLVEGFAAAPLDLAP